MNWPVAAMSRRACSLKTFATQRASGAPCSTSCARVTWMSRSSRKVQKRHRARRAGWNKAGPQPAGVLKIAGEMGMSLADYQNLLGKVRGTNWCTWKT